MAQTTLETEPTPRRSATTPEPASNGTSPAAASTSAASTTADSPSADSPKPTGGKHKSILLLVVVTLAIIGGIAGVRYAIHAQHFEDTDDASLEGHVIPINPQISAEVAGVFVHDNQLVKKGDLLVKLDPTDYAVAIEQANGSLAAAEGRLVQAKAQVPAAEALKDEATASLESAQTNFANIDATLKRYLQLDERARSQEQVDNATANQKSARSAVAEAQAKLASAESQIINAQANVVTAQGDVEKAQADLHRAQVNLSYCEIRSPDDGRVTRKNVETGEYVTPAQALLAVVPPKVWVVANFKETQLTYMRPGQPATIDIDAYPGKTFTGQVESIQSGTGSRFSMLPAENATGNFVKIVQRVPVKILLDPDQNDDATRALVPGMSVEAEVHVR